MEVLNFNIDVLCVDKDSVYKSIPGISCWDKERDAYTYRGTNPVITHAPCQQWSRLRAFSKPNDYEKGLAEFCYRKVKENGGIFEHPAGSSFFKLYNLDMRKVYQLDQSDFGFPAKKATWLYVEGIKLLPYPIFKEARHLDKVASMAQRDRSRTPIAFAIWLIDSIRSNEMSHTADGLSSR